MYNRTKYASYWNEQDRLRNEILRDQALQSRNNVSELDRYKQGEIDRVKREVKDYEASHGYSGNFLKDMKWSLGYANDHMLKPFNT
jgi:hypothetical protein